MSLYKIWRAGLDSALDSASVTNGTVLVTTDSNRLFVDYNNNRFEITDFVKDTEANILTVISPLPKFYYATDTHKLYVYDGGWVAINEDYTHPNVTVSNTTSTVSPSHGGTFTVIDGVTRDSQGHVTGVNVKTVTLPTDNNTDTKMTQTASTSSNSFPVLAADSASPTSGSASTGVYSTGVTINPSTNTINATTFDGNLSGNADTATKATQDGNGKNIASTYAPLASPALTGTPTAPTAATGTSTTQIATTAFVAAAVIAGVGGVDLSNYVTLDGAEALTNKTYNGYTLAAACAKGLSDSSAAEALSSTDTNVPTVRDIFYGLPTINGSHAYTSGTSIYAPTAVGTSGYVLRSSGSGAPSWVAQSSLTAGKATADASGNTITTTYAPLASPALTGTPTAPTATAGTSTTQIATTAFVSTAVSNAIANVVQFDVQVVTSLPTTGETGVIYLIADQHEDSSDSYDEYLWVSSTSTFEKIGNTDIDLSGYVTLTGSEALTNKTYNGYTLASACAKSYTDRSTATAISSSGTTLLTERAVYYGLPTINGSHSYTSSTNIYAPTSVGTSGYLVQSSGSGAPSWVAQSSITAGKATADASGNTITSTYAPLASPALTGTPTAPTATAGTSTTQIATTAFVATAVSNGVAGIDLSDYATLSGSEALTNKTYNGYTLASACAKSYTDRSTATAISSSGTTLLTERSVYYGLPTINNSHAYTSSTTIYAPTSGGTAGYFLRAAGTTTAPDWVTPANTRAYLGLGYGTCSVAAATAAKTSSISNFALLTGAMVAITFTYAVGAGDTLNVNSTGAKSIYHMGAAIKDDVIQAGATALFVYTGSYWYLLAVDTEAGGDYIDEDA